MTDETQIEEPQVDDQQQQGETPAPQPPDKLKILHDAVSKDYDIGTIDEFKQKLQDPTKRKAFYDAIGKDYDLGNYDEFQQKIGIANPAPLHQNDIAGIRQLNDFAQQPTKTTGAGDMIQPEDDQDRANKQKAASDYADKVVGLAKDWGLKPEDAGAARQVLNDFPTENDEGKLKDRLSLLQSNPIAYNRFKAADENVKLLSKADPTNHTANQYNQLQGDPDAPIQSISELQRNISLQRDMINSTLSGDDRDKALANLEANRSASFNVTNPEIKQEYDNNKDLNGNLDIIQYAGLKSLEAFDPAKYQLYSGMLKKREDEKNDTVEMKLGLEKAKKELLDIGRKNTYNFINENQANLGNQYDNEQDPEKKTALATAYNNNLNGIKTLDADAKQDDGRFPYTKDLEFDRQAKELAGEPDRGVLMYALSKFGKGIGKAVSGIQNVATDVFGSDRDVAENKLQRLGESQQDQNEDYLPEKYKGEGSQMVYKFDKPLQEAANRIKNDDKLSDEEKNQKIVDLVKANQDSVHTITNPNAGKSANFFSKATLYKNAGMIGDLASIAAQMEGGNAGGIPKLISNTAPMFLSAQNDYYKQALEEGKANPSAYANLHAAVMMAAGLVNPDINIAKRALGVNTEAGKLIAGIDEKTWDNIVSANKPLLTKIKNSASGAFKESAKLAAVYGAGTSIANDLVNKGFFNENLSKEDILNHAAKATKDLAISSVGLLGLHAVSNFGLKEVSPEQKAAIWEVGDNPKLASEKIDDEVKAGNFTTQQADEKKQIIKNISKLIDKVPSENVNGKPLTDKARTDYLYNLIIKNKAGELKSDLPEGQAEKVAATMEEADKANGAILNGSQPKLDIEEPVKKITPTEKVSVVRPEDNTKPNIVDLKNNKDALQIGSPAEILQRQQGESGETGSGRERVERSDEGDEPTRKGGDGQPPTEKESENQSEEKSPRVGGIARRIQEKLGLRDYEAGKGWSKEESLAFGRAAIDHGVDPVKLFDDPKYTDLEPHERLAVAQAHAIELSKQINEAGDNGNTKLQSEKEKELADFQKLIQPAKTKSSQAFTAQQGEFDTDLGSFTSVKNKISPDKPLESGQVQKVKKLTSTNKELEIKTQETESKLIQETDKELGNNKPPESSPKNKTSKKSHSEYVKERKDAFTAAREALRKLRTGESGLGSSLPLARELAAVAPHIATIVKSLIEEGVDKLGDIVDNIHDELSKDMQGLRRRDVMDLVAGDYNKDKAVQGDNKYADIKKQSTLVKKLEDLQNGLPEDFDKDRPQQSPEVKKLLEQIKKVKKDLSDMGYMKEKPTWKEEPLSAEEKNIKRLEKELEETQAGNPKQKSPTREQSEKEKELKEQIRDEREKLGLVASKGEKPLTEGEQIEDNEQTLKTLQEKLINKKGNQFTPEESKAIWNHMKQNYLDKGIGFRDAVKDVSDDTGLSFEQVSHAITTPKTKPISDQMWKSRYDLSRNRAATERYIHEQGTSPAIKAVKKFTNFFRELSVFGHGGVFVGTHAGMTLMDLPRAKYTVRAFLNAYKLAYGKTANYEKAMEQLKSEDNYVLAQRAGLKNNPDRLNNDSEIIKPLFGKFSESGVKGFNAIKVLRQALFDSHYNALSDEEKANPKSAEAVARLVNNATGASNLDLTIRDKEGNVKFDPNEFLFAGGMEAARWGKLTRNPIEATKTALTAMFNPEKASVEDKVFAKVWAKRVGTELATFAGLLTVNAALQHTLNKGGNPVNFTDPTKSDWMKMKMGNTTFDFTSGMLSTLHFIENTAYEPFKKSKDDIATREAKDIFKYGRGKLSPFYGDVADVATSHDFSGNTLPWSDAKPLNKFNHKMSWPEFISSKAPLPVAEGFKAFYESAQQNGLSKDRIDNILDGLKYGAISGTTGFKAYENHEGENKPKAKPHS